MRPLSKTQSRVLALALLILFVTLGVMILVVPLNLLYTHYDAAFDNQSDLLARYVRLAAMRGEVQKALDQVRKAEGRKHFLKNSGAALAASEIQEITKSLIEANEGKLSSMQVTPFKDEGAYRRITINVQLVSGTPALRKIFYSLETMKPYLLVDNVNINSASNYTLKPTAGVEPEMTVQFDVTGYAVVADGK